VQIRNDGDGIGHRIAALQDGVAEVEFVGLVFHGAATELEQFVVEAFGFLTGVCAKAELQVVGVLRVEHPADVCALWHYEVAHVGKFLVGATDVGREIEFGVERQDIRFAKHIQNVVAALHPGGEQLEFRVFLDVGKLVGKLVGSVLFEAVLHVSERDEHLVGQHRAVHFYVQHKIGKLYCPERIRVDEELKWGWFFKLGTAVPKAHGAFAQDIGGAQKQEQEQHDGWQGVAQVFAVFAQVDGRLERHDADFLAFWLMLALMSSA
jgi:hypothetical protein